MKRKLIDFDVFKKIETESLSHAESELVQAGEILSNVLEQDEILLHCFGENTVIYETHDGTFVHANYQVDDKAITFDNVEELIVDETQEKTASRGLVSQMVEELLEGNSAKADQLFDEYISSPSVRRSLNESNKPFRLVPVKGKSGKVTGYKKGKKRLSGPRHQQKAQTVAKRMRSKIKHNKSLSRGEKNRRKQLRGAASRRYGLMKEHINYAATISENVLNYVEFKELGPAIDQTVVKHDEKGNVIAVRVPTSKVRNEGKILSFNWKTLNTEIKTMRSGAKTLGENAEFVKAIAELKRQHAFSNDNDTQQVLEAITVKWPEILYLTQTELAGIVGEALSSANITNYDDQTCDFLAESILRNVFNTYGERVEKLVKLAQFKNENEDVYAGFQAGVEGFFNRVDEESKLEMQVFVDLYNTLRDIHKHAVKTGDEFLKEEADDYLRDLYAVCNGQLEPTLNLAEEVAAWLEDLVETNLESEPWNPTNSVHTTLSGDHPHMNKLAGTSYKPSADFDGSGGGLQVSDGKSYKNGLEDNMRNNSWGNAGGNETYPELKNPYIPKSFGDYTMKGEPGVDKNSDDGVSQWQSGDTWPNLQNPYNPKAETPQSYKMNGGKEKDLVVDL